MKRMILTVVAMMAMTLSFAETEETQAVKNVETYDMTFDMRRLAVTLGLTSDQMEAVKDITDNFNTEMQTAATTTNCSEREAQVDEALRKDVHYMHYVLNDKQFQTYMTLLKATLRNRGLK